MRYLQSWREHARSDHQIGNDEARHSKWQEDRLTSVYEDQQSPNKEAYLAYQDEALNRPLSLLAISLGSSIWPALVCMKRRASSHFRDLKPKRRGFWDIIVNHTCPIDDTKNAVYLPHQSLVGWAQRSPHLGSAMSADCFTRPQ